MTFVKIYYANRVFQYKSLLVRKWHAKSLIVVSKGEPVLCIQQMNLLLASCRIFSFSTISTPMPPSIAFLCYTTISVKFITHTGSVQASNWQAPPPPYTANILHHHALVSVLTIHRSFSLKEALYLETYQINYLKKKRYLQIYKN